MKTKLSGILTLLLAFAVQLTFAQERTITGNITDESGPLPGVSVIIEGTTTGTETDFDGNYAIDAATGVTLQYSFVGMTTVVRTVGNTNVINVTMVTDENTLDEVVVTAFGIERNSKSVGYALSKVDNEEITGNSEPDMIRSLAGKVAGVNVNFSTGVAGSSNQINIRGATTIGGSSQPLIIVDGVAYSNNQVTTVDLGGGESQSTGGGGYESAISSLDPNDIESINVLKSTVAAALYGSRATDGVIVITTKSGSGTSTNKKMNITISSGTYFENIANLPDYQNTYGNGVNGSYVNANGSWGPRFDSLETIPTWPNLLEAFPYLGPTQPFVAQPNNVKDLFTTGITTDNSINLAYGNEDGHFGVTVSNLNQNGYIPFNTFDRTSASVGGSYKLDNGITFGGSLSYSETDQVGGYFGENQFDGSSSSFARTLFMGRTWNTSLPYVHPDTGFSVIPNGGWDHPLWSWEHDQIITSTQRTVANIHVGYNFDDHISVTYRFGMNKYDLARKQIRDLGSRSDNGVGAVTTDDFSNEDIESTLLMNFDYDIGNNFAFHGILGNNILQNTQERHAVIGNTFISPGIFTIENNLNISLVQPSPTNGIGTLRKKNIGVFADLGFSFKEFLFLNVTGRNDWSSTLPEDNNSYFYPSISTSFVFTDAFKMDGDVLTFGKIRAGYASVGRDAAAEFLNRTFAVGQAYNGAPVIGNRTSLGDTKLTPEFTTEIEIGADLEFFQRRIAIDFSWYKKITTDLISPVSISTTSGFDTFNTNIGEIENSGIEIELTLVPIRSDNFRWSILTTFSNNKNIVNELVEGLDIIKLNPNEVAHAVVGEPFGVFYGTRFARDANGAFLINQSGGGIVEDPTDGVIGDPNPDFRMSIFNSLSYKGLSLNVQFDWKEGGDIHSTSLESLLGRGVTKDTEDRERTFIIPGFYGDNNGIPILDAQGNQIPNTVQLSMNELYFSPAGGNTFAINSVEESGVYDGTVYRLRELSLTYDFPSKLIEKLPFGKISFSLVGNNLWYFAPNVPKYSNFDPEVTSFGSTRLQGIEIAAAPTSKRYGFRLNLTF